MRYATLIMVICVFLAQIGLAATIHVPADQPTIQAGIDSAMAGDTVLVACGLYIEWDITLKNGVCLLSETGQPDCDSIDCHMISRIFIADGVDSTTIIEGFAIAHGSIDSAGAGMICQSASPTIKNCRFCVHWSTNFGGAAVYIKNNSSPRFINCDFIDNWASSFSPAKNPDGAAIMCDSNSSGIFENCTFDHNMAQDDGGAAYAINYSSLTFEGCTFIGNRAEADSAGGSSSGGGAIYLYNNSQATFNNCVFDKDTSYAYGGAVAAYNNSTATLNFCTFTHNIAENGGALWCDDNSAFIITNCTFSQNTGNSSAGGILCANGTEVNIENSIIAFSLAGEAIVCDDLTPIVNCCDIYGNSGGDWTGCIASLEDINGNFSLDPLFCDTSAGNYRILYTSPCAPENNDCDTLIGANPSGCYDLEISAFAILNEACTQHVVDHTPLFSWDYQDIGGDGQTAYEIEVGTDNDWTTAEMWDPEIVETSDTSAEYAGSGLSDGEDYYLRLRIYNDYVWSAWYEDSFRMNTAPGSPACVSPECDEIVTKSPVFIINNSLDAEGDSLKYIFQIADDTLFNSIVLASPQITAGNITTSWSCPVMLSDNSRYYWRAKALDGFEESGWSADPVGFWIMGCGDANSDRDVNVSDAVYIINYVFVGGDPPNPIESGDCNCDGTCNVSDAVMIINYVFVGGNTPCDTDGDGQPDC
jgi:hypothetical protein